jgi:hypothetical protein
MFDTNLLFHNAAALTTSGNSASLDIRKTAAEGAVVEIAVTALAGSTTGRTIDFIVQESDDDSAYNNNTTFAQLSATGRVTRRVQSKKRYLRLNRVVGTGTGASFTVTAGIVSGNIKDQTA